ncbi:hypothetical protein [Actinomadura sp. DC4]|uniref:hypothetical protein n=1 Tax=Actinomadura sp. DC4 TaxID=3055069 RepID=UPI0025B0546C|nr:hypothetical protein [Actinomadura sp. DC4]MDN3357550.1 hypothetical protein [Actinomadura sp. DC4]
MAKSFMAALGAAGLAGAFVLFAGEPGSAAARAACSTSAVSDFNGDGYSDAAVGEPGRSVAGAAQAGVVHVRYGASGGRVGSGTEATLSQNDTGETAESGDRFGSVLKVGYVDSDSCADLVVGVPGEDVGALTDAGVVQVIYGSADGLGQGQPTRVIRPGADGVPGTSAAQDGFGSAVDVSGSSAVIHALVVGSPGTDVGAASDAGQVTYVPATGQAVALTQDTAGVPGTAESGDRFGAAVTLGSLHGADSAVAAGAPGEAIGTLANAGSVTAITGLSDVTVTGYAISQDSDGIAGAAEAGDRFGASLSWTRPSTGIPTLAVGVPGEDLGTVADAGMVHVLDGNALTDLTSITQDTAGVADTAEAGDGFGSVVALARDSGSGVRLAVGVPAEDHGTDAGAVQEFAISGQTVTANALVDRESLGGTSTANGRFGASVSYAGPSLRPTWLIGAPGEAVVYADYTRLGPADVPPPTPTLQTWTSTESGAGFGTAVAGAVS